MVQNSGPKPEFYSTNRLWTETHFRAGKFWTNMRRIKIKRVYFPGANFWLFAIAPCWVYGFFGSQNLHRRWSSRRNFHNKGKSQHFEIRLYIKIIRQIEEIIIRFQNNMKIRIDEQQWAVKSSQTFLLKLTNLKNMYVGGVPAKVADFAKGQGRIMATKRFLSTLNKTTIN